MQSGVFVLPHPGAIFVAAAALLLLVSTTQARPIELTITPVGSAASGRPLPVGATPTLKVTLHNTSAQAVGPIELTARLKGLAPGKAEGWSQAETVLRSTIKAIPGGTHTERELRVRVTEAPIEPAAASVSIEAKIPNGEVIENSIKFSVADCVGAYRGRLAALRPTLPQAVREAADAMRRSDPDLPAGRLFPTTGARGGDLARAERLAATFAAGRGADPQLSTEWFRFLLQRWGSELNAYAGQTANPGLCASNYYQIAGYRQGLLPITKHIETTRTAAEFALALLREETGATGEKLDDIVRSLIDKTEAMADEQDAGPLAALAEKRAALPGEKLKADAARQLSLAETAAWLAETNRRGERLVQSIEEVLSTIARVHKESCTCAF